MDDQAAAALFERVEALLDGADERTLEVVGAIVELYGEGMARMVAATDGALDALLRDELVSHLLLLHDLHPVPVEDRVRGAVAAAGGDADLVGIEDGVVRLRPHGGGCASCGASAPTKRQAVEEAVAAAAPDVDGVEWVDPAAPALVLPQVQVREAGPAPA